MIGDSEYIISLKRACNEFINYPRPIDDQPHQRSGIFVWCEDWEITELLKCLFNGDAVYTQEASPKRLKNNPLFSKDEIIRKARELRERFPKAEDIVNHFKERRNGSPQR